MSNEFNVWASLVETAEASTALVTLVGKANPLVAWGDLGTSLTRPYIAGRIQGGRYPPRGKDSLEYRLVLDVFVENNSTGLESHIADELETIITNSNLGSTSRTYPVDVAPFKRARFPQPELDEGRIRLTLEYDLWQNR